MSNTLYKDLSDLSERIINLKEKIQTEEATKMSFIVPFFQLLDYDVYDPTEFVPEFTADAGTKKHEKVDYAIMINDKPLILIEAKCCHDKLDRHDEQLLRYFAFTEARFGVLTNGIEYRFYTDLDASNKMDLKPFLVIDMLDLKESSVAQLDKFRKSNFDLDNIINSAEELKYTNAMINLFNSEYNEPSEDFVKYILGRVYDKPRTQLAIDKFTPIVNRAFKQFINEIINGKIKTAFPSSSQAMSKSNADDVATDIDAVEDEASKIVTTQEELDAFNIIRAILSEHIDIDRVQYKDTESYFGVLIDGKVKSWICRLYLGPKKQRLEIPLENGEVKKIQLDNIYSIYAYRDLIANAVKKYVKIENQ